MLILATLCLLFAAIPAALFFANLRLYAPPPAPGPNPLPPVSILIPARNEAAGIADALHAALASRNIDFEILVMDDSSTDATPDIVQTLATTHPQLRLRQAPPLPPGWNGKQHACWELAHAARNPILCFVDADVRLAPECIARMTSFLIQSDSALVSGFPRQLTETSLEWLLLPLIHFVLLGFLPLSRMRAGTQPGFAAGCGQFLLCRREAYFLTGGHSGIRLTMHDGLRLPRLFREHGLRTDLADLTPYATCRMYTNATQTWNGLAKNATEGIAAPARIVPVTFLLLLGQVLPFLPFVLLLSSPFLAVLLGSLGMDFHLKQPVLASLVLVGLFFPGILAYSVRFTAARRFQQDWRSALLHPIGVLLLLAIQWYALTRQLLRRPVTWRTRSYSKP